jgi:hypothetical protein
MMKKKRRKSKRIIFSHRKVNLMNQLTYKLNKSLTFDIRMPRLKREKIFELFIDLSQKLAINFIK